MAVDQQVRADALPIHEQLHEQQQVSDVRVAQALHVRLLVNHDTEVQLQPHVGSEDR